MRNNILIIISENYNNQDYKEWVENIFSDENIDIFVIDGRLEKIDQKLSSADMVLNFVDNKGDFEYIQKKIEILKIPFFGNKMVDIKLFLEKDNFKKIVDKSNFKTPVFEKISSKTPIELFNNFIHPSRIFSKKDNFFSGKNQSLDDLKNIFDNIGDNIKDYFIEEFIEGDNVYMFLFPGDDGKNNIFPVIVNDGVVKKLNSEVELKVIEKVSEFMEYSGIKDFVLFNLIYSKKRGLYFLNIYLKNNILFEYNDILNEILKVHKYPSLREILKKNLF